MRVSLFQFVVLLAVRTAGTLAASGKTAATPVRGLEASWAAAASTRTVSALFCGDAVGCLVLIQTGKKQTQTAIPVTTGVSDERAHVALDIDGVPLLIASSQSAAAPVTFAAPWRIHKNNNKNHSTLFWAMTGLATDLEHLHRRMDFLLDQWQAVYDDLGQTGAEVAPKMVNAVSSWLQERALKSSSRPFAVQILLFEEDTLYVIDPSGGWQSYRQGAVVGKAALAVQKRLAQELKTHHQSSQEMSLSTGIRILLKGSCLLDSEESDDQERQMLFLPTANGKPSRICEVDEAYLQKVMEELTQEEKGEAP